MGSGFAIGSHNRPRPNRTDAPAAIYDRFDSTMAGIPEGCQCCEIRKCQGSGTETYKHFRKPVAAAGTVLDCIAKHGSAIAGNPVRVPAGPLRPAAGKRRSLHRREKFELR